MESMPGKGTDAHADLTAEIRRSIERIGRVDRHSDGYLTALAFVLHRVAAADHHLDPAEIRRMEDILVDRAGLSPAEAVLTVEMAKHQCRMADCGRAYDASRHLRLLLTAVERSRVRRFLDSVAAADGLVVRAEEAEVEQLTIELGLDRAPLSS